MCTCAIYHIHELRFLFLVCSSCTLWLAEATPMYDTWCDCNAVIRANMFLTEIRNVFGFTVCIPNFTADWNRSFQANLFVLNVCLNVFMLYAWFSTYIYAYNTGSTTQGRGSNVGSFIALPGSHNAQLGFVSIWMHIGCRP